jgi:hypothetical protein
MGDWRFFLCPPRIIEVNDLPEGWGLFHALPKTIKRVHRVPPNTMWWKGKRFNGAKQYEMQMMYSALRRMVIRGHFDSVYKK